MSGKEFNLEDDNEILKINSPKVSLEGPFTVVYKNLDERWAIVAINWDGEPRLGMRWFWANGGNPFSSGHPTWLVIPPSLSKGVLSSLPLDHSFATKVDDFLSEKLSGDSFR
ncbi:hypothetical protein [Vibrio mediterranei]|uniref:Uncharacterized protein n=1 Tax=Vibrio mediterranei TaxID=689 RepID=A0A3G4VKD6_9VIBR|nr:hypothetical protein [Vibrio mediterranei]AYV24468.1 hypothetical protein ECB94_24760 [Vibrio mediterranei]